MLAWWLVKRKREGKVALIDPDLFRIKNFRVGASAMVLQQITLGGAMIALPLYLQVTLGVQRDAGRSVARPTVAHDVRRRPARREEGR